MGKASTLGHHLVEGLRPIRLDRKARIMDNRVKVDLVRRKYRLKEFQEIRARAGKLNAVSGAVRRQSPPLRAAHQGELMWQVSRKQPQYAFKGEQGRPKP
jgi:hypothetical protein